MLAKKLREITTKLSKIVSKLNQPRMTRSVESLILAAEAIVSTAPRRVRRNFFREWGKSRSRRRSQFTHRESRILCADPVMFQGSRKNLTGFEPTVDTTHLSAASSRMPQTILLARQTLPRRFAALYAMPSVIVAEFARIQPRRA